MTEGYEFEGLWRRFVAAVIDNAGWLLFYAWFIGSVVSATYEESPEAAGIIVLLFLSAWFNYFALCEWRWGQTIGKNAMGMKVISLDRGKISYGQASIRNLLRLVDFFVVGWVMIAADDKHQRLGDKAAKTVVVRSRFSEARNYAEAPISGGAPDPEPQPEPANAADPDSDAAAAEGGAPDRGWLPAIEWTVGNTVRGLITGLLLALVLPFLVLPFDPGLDSDAGLLAAQALFGCALIVVAVGTASRWDFSPLGDALRALGLRSAALKAFGIALLTLVVYYLAAGLISQLLFEPKQDDIAGELGVDDPNVLVAVSAVLLIAILAPISEELFFRGMVYSGLRLRFSLWPAAILSGIIFGLPHALTGPLAAVVLAGLGVALAWLYERTGSLWPCIFIHVINNSIALAVAV